jgi:Na+/H+ antiporter NhaC
MLKNDKSPGLQSPQSGGDDDFWANQQKLAKEMTGVVEKSRQADAREKFQKRRLALVTDTAYFGFFIFCLLWAFFDNPFVAFSYSLGSVLGLAYAYGLGRYVEKFGGNTVEDFESAQAGAGVGEARLAFLFLLIIILGKYRSAGLVEVPAIAGFFTYQLASLNQGLQEIDD